MKKIGVMIAIVLGALTFYFSYARESSLPEAAPPQDSLTLRPQSVSLANGSKFDLQAPEGYEVSVAAEGMKRIRFMAMSPDGHLFLTDMHDMTDNRKGKVYVLSDFDPESRRFKKRATYLSGLRNPNSIAFHTDAKGGHWLYLALTDKLVRYAYSAGKDAPASGPRTIARFPGYGNSYKYGGWHLTRTVAIHADKIYVSVGSSCNACEERQNETRASIIVMDLDGSNRKTYAAGLRNAVGMKWVGDTLFATEMGSDHLGDDKPADEMHAIREGIHYGWPYCYEHGGSMHEDASRPWKRKNVDCKDVPLSYAALQAHSAPLGLEHFDENAAPELKNAFLVALHGSGQVRIGNGYSIVRVSEGSEPREFIGGFLQNGKRMGRPVDILKVDEKSFFFSDDHAGVLYHVMKR